MLDPLMVALWQATMAERRGQTKSAPGRGPVGVRSLFSLCPFLYLRMFVARALLKTIHQPSPIKICPSTIANHVLFINDRS